MTTLTSKFATISQNNYLPNMWPTFKKNKTGQHSARKTAAFSPHLQYSRRLQLHLNAPLISSTGAKSLGGPRCQRLRPQGESRRFPLLRCTYRPQVLRRPTGSPAQTLNACLHRRARKPGQPTTRRSVCDQKCDL